MRPEYDGGPRLPSVWTVLAVVVVIYMAIPLLKMLLPIIGVLALLLLIYNVMFKSRI